MSSLNDAFKSKLSIFLCCPCYHGWDVVLTLSYQCPQITLRIAVAFAPSEVLQIRIVIYENDGSFCSLFANDLPTYIGDLSRVRLFPLSCIMNLGSFVGCTFLQSWKRWMRPLWSTTVQWSKSIGSRGVIHECYREGCKLLTLLLWPSPIRKKMGILYLGATRTH